MRLNMALPDLNLIQVLFKQQALPSRMVFAETLRLDLTELALAQLINMGVKMVTLKMAHELPSTTRDWLDSERLKKR